MSQPYPPVCIDASDYHRLRSIAVRALEERHPVSHFLHSELQRAIVSESHSSLHCVRLNEWVTYRADAGFPRESRMLVLPEHFRNGSLHVSVLSPLGAALIGLPVNSCMPYVGIDGTHRTVTVESLDPPDGIVSLQRWRRTRQASDEHDPDPSGPTAA